MSATPARDCLYSFDSIGETLVDSVPILVAYVDRDFVYRFCNLAYEDWFDCKRSEIVNHKTVEEIVGAAAFEEIRPYIERAFLGEQCGYEKSLTLPNGRQGHFRSIYTPHYDADGKVIGMIAMVEDVTDRRLTEKHLIDRERTLQLALDAGEFGTWSVDIEKRVAELDATLARLFQLPDHERFLPLDRFVELVAPHDRERIAIAVQRTLNDEDDFSEQFQTLFPDGGSEWFSSYGKIHRDESGVARRVIGVTHNITHQKQAEEELRILNEDLESIAAENAEALQMSKANLRAIVATAADAILTVSAQNTILSANPSALGLFGAGSDPGALIGKPISQLLSTDAVALIAQASQGNANGDRLSSKTTHARRLNGTEFSAEFSLAHAKGVPFSVVLIRDISERREVESEVMRATEEEKQRIARDLHDGLGSVLGGITCLAKALETELAAGLHPSTGKATEIGQAAQESVTTARRLAHGLHAVGSHPEALVDALQEFVQTAAAGNPISFHFNCPEPIKISDHVVANHLFRITQEAATNAMRHSTANSVEISLKKEDGMLLLSICDNGSGFSTRDVTDHHGFGLRTMRFRASEVSGSLDIESTEQGTRVTCRVPFSDIAHPAAE